MKLRTRLFLWVGIIFLLAFGVSLLFETYITDRDLKNAEATLRREIFCFNEENRQHIERFLHVKLSEDQAKVDSLLFRIARDPDLGAKLFIDAKDAERIAPAHSTFLFKDSQWIDFIQTTKEGKLTSLLIPIDFPMDIAHELPINEKISWVVLDDDREIKRPFIGIKFVAPPKQKETEHPFLMDELVDADWGLTIFFDPEALLKFQKKGWEEGQEIEGGINLLAFEEATLEAVQYLKDTKEKYQAHDWVHKAVQDLNKGGLFASKPEDLGIRCMQEEGERLNSHIIELLQRGDQAIMLASLASLFPSGSYGDSPFVPLAPKGVARFPQKQPTGRCVLTQEAFLQSPMFRDAQYFALNPSTKECEEVGSARAVIASENREKIFFGNTLQIKGKDGEGYLTIAIDAEEFIGDLVLSVDQSAFLVHGGQVVVAFSKDGKKIHDAKNSIPFDKKMLQEKSGIIQWEGQRYYFLHMIPFKSLDLHFYLLQPEKKAFALVRAVSEGSREVIQNISMNMRIVALISLICVLLLLHNVAKRITRPIAQLAKITQDVAKGKLEGLNLPTPPKGRHDEITTLCQSFAQMIKGLQEKEKVKGVLNKVVSPQIAEEITKGQVKLGGEERKITVLFADIRNFTHMSANKPPHEVIEMLNTCMTKISHVVDEFEGVIDKYVGDEVMALFGAPLEKEDSALKAVLSGLEMIQVLENWNEKERKGLERVEMGIGIHTGVVLVGNMGAENRLNYTVIGSNVNLAARLCSAAKGMEILISEATLNEPHVRENIEVEQLPPTELKGFDESFVLFRVKGKKG